MPRMRVWVDITNSPHVLFFRPLIRLLRGGRARRLVTAREYAQTLELLELHGLAHEVVGPRHGGAGVSARRVRSWDAFRRCDASRRRAASTWRSHTARTS